MEGGKQSGSSLASDLFGAKDSSEQANSVGIFRTIFPPQPKVFGREPFQYLETEKKICSENPAWTSKNGVSGQAQSAASKDKVLPFHYNSSIYYGGQDDYTPSESAQKSGTTFNKDGGEDQSDSSSIRSWWQGSVYY